MGEDVNSSSPNLIKRSEMGETRVCKICHRELPTTEFYSKGRGRLMTQCKECHKRMKQDPELNKKAIEEIEIVSSNISLTTKRKVIEVLPDGYKRCATCHKIFPLKEFAMRRGGEGRIKSCTKCAAKHRKKVLAHYHEKQRLKHEEQALRGSDLGRLTSTQKRLEKERGEAALLDFRKEEVARIKEHPTEGRKYANRKDACRFCKFFLTPKCDGLNLLMYSSDYPCRSFIELKV